MRLNMTSKITVVVDLDEEIHLNPYDSYPSGVYGMDRDGVYHMYHGNKSYLVTFSPPKSCEYCSHNTCNCEEIIDKNIQAQERTGQQ